MLARSVLLTLLALVARVSLAAPAPVWEGGYGDLELLERQMDDNATCHVQVRQTVGTAPTGTYALVSFCTPPVPCNASATYDPSVPIPANATACAVGQPEGGDGSEEGEDWQSVQMPCDEQYHPLVLGGSGPTWDGRCWCDYEEGGCEIAQEIVEPDQSSGALTTELVSGVPTDAASTFFEWTFTGSFTGSVSDAAATASSSANLSSSSSSSSSASTSSASSSSSSAASISSSGSSGAASSAPTALGFSIAPTSTSVSVVTSSEPAGSSPTPSSLTGGASALSGPTAGCAFALALLAALWQ